MSHQHGKNITSAKIAHIIHRIQEIINKVPGKSLGCIAKEMNMSDATIRKIVAEDIRYKLCANVDEVPIVKKTKYSSTVMVLGVVSNVVMTPHFFKQGLGVNADAYIDVLQNVVVPWMKHVTNGRHFTFQQDGAPTQRQKS